MVTGQSMPGPMLAALSISLIMTVLQGSCYAHFANEETEVWRY